MESQVIFARSNRFRQSQSWALTIHDEIIINIEGGQSSCLKNAKKSFLKRSRYNSRRWILLRQSKKIEESKDPLPYKTKKNAKNPHLIKQSKTLTHPLTNTPKITPRLPHYPTLTLKTPQTSPQRFRVDAHLTIEKKLKLHVTILQNELISLEGELEIELDQKQA